jgi:tryptophan-rich sensory protein
MKKISWFKLIVSIIICFGTAALGSAATTPKIQTWYAALNKPFFSPPNWVFGPVWTLLYLLMAIALYQVWVKKKSLTNRVFNWFWIQLFLNSLWSWVFFGWENPGLALVVIGGLWFSIVKTRENFKFQLPYLCWVSFASCLNAAVWWLNR